MTTVDKQLSLLFLLGLVAFQVWYSMVFGVVDLPGDFSADRQAKVIAVTLVSVFCVALLATTSRRSPPPGALAVCWPVAVVVVLATYGYLLENAWFPWLQDLSGWGLALVATYTGYTRWPAVVSLVARHRLVLAAVGVAALLSGNPTLVGVFPAVLVGARVARSEWVAFALVLLASAGVLIVVGNFGVPRLANLMVTLVIMALWALRLIIVRVRARPRRVFVQVAATMGLALVVGFGWETLAMEAKSGDASLVGRLGEVEAVGAEAQSGRQILMGSGLGHVPDLALSELISERIDQRVSTTIHILPARAFAVGGLAALSLLTVVLFWLTGPVLAVGLWGSEHHASLASLAVGATVDGIASSGHFFTSCVLGVALGASVALGGSRARGGSTARRAREERRG